MEQSTSAFWEKAKSAREFVAGIVGITVVVYGLSWVADDLIEHTHIDAEHQWWAYKMWQACWWMIAPLAMVIGGRLLHRRIISKGLWVVGVLWLAFVGFGAGMALWGRLLMSLVVPFGWLVGNILLIAGVLLIAFGCVIFGKSFDRASRRWPLIARLITEIC